MTADTKHSRKFANKNQYSLAYPTQKFRIHKWEVLVAKSDKAENVVTSRDIVMSGFRETLWTGV